MKTPRNEMSLTNMKQEQIFAHIKLLISSLVGRYNLQGGEGIQRKNLKNVLYIPIGITTIENYRQVGIFRHDKKNTN